MDGKTKATGFYRGDAARLASEAARLPNEATARLSASSQTSTPAVQLEDPDRPLLTPEPHINQNIAAPAYVDARRRPRVAAIVAWIILSPWYAATLAASIGLDALFIKDLLHL